MKNEKRIKEMADSAAQEWFTDIINDGSDNSTYLKDAYEIGHVNGYTEAQKDMEPKGKYLTVSEMRDMEKQVLNGEISYSKMLELINERIGWKPGEWHELKRKEVGNG
jgi:hypothetical protein